MIVRLSHPWKYHHTLDVLSTEDGDLTENEAAHLIRAGFAVDTDTLIVPTGGGWFDVTTSKGTAKVKGHAAGLEALREDAGQ